MQIFQDTTGEDWRIDLNIGTARKIRQRMRTVDSLSQCDFLDYAELLFSLNDVFFAAELLYVVCEDEASGRGVDSETFGTRLRGRVLFDAIAAFTAEYLNFFPDPTTAQKMGALVEKNQKVQTTLCDAIVNAAEGELQKVLDDVATKLSALSSTTSPLQAPAGRELSV